MGQTPTDTAEDDGDSDGDGDVYLNPRGPSFYVYAGNPPTAVKETLTDALNDLLSDIDTPADESIHTHINPDMPICTVRWFESDARHSEYDLAFDFEPAAFDGSEAWYSETPRHKSDSR